MNKASLRIFFLAPVLMIAIGIVLIFSDHSSLPPAAQEYLQWYANQSVSPVHWVLNKIAVLGLIGIAASSLALLFFWPPARYLYVASIGLALLGEITNIPTLVTGGEGIIDNILQILLGFNVALIFFSPARAFFIPKQQA